MIAASADLGALAEWLDVNLNGTPLGRLCMPDGRNCPAAGDADVATITLTAEQFNAAVGPADADVTGDGQVDAFDIHPFVMLLAGE